MRRLDILKKERRLQDWEINRTSLEDVFLTIRNLYTETAI
jgi:adenylosuccinate lyase